MKIKMLISFILLVAFLSCKKEQVILPVEKVYVLQANNLVDDFSDPDFMRVLGIIEINKDFTIQVISMGGDSLFSHSEFQLSDSTKNIILELTMKYFMDSIYYKEVVFGEGLKTLVIEMESDEYARIGPNLPEKLEPIVKQIFEHNQNSGQIIQNKDSIKTYLNKFKKLIIMPFPPHPVKHSIEFEPPVNNQK